MSFIDCIKTQNVILMEGALGERLKRAYQLKMDDHVAMATLAMKHDGIYALKALCQEYIAIADGSYWCALYN